MTGTLMAVANAFSSSVYAVDLGPIQFSAYAGLIALGVNRRGDDRAAGRDRALTRRGGAHRRSGRLLSSAPIDIL